MEVTKKPESYPGHLGVYSIVRERTKKTDWRHMEPNRSVNRLKYLINLHSITNQEKKSFPADKWEESSLSRITECDRLLGLPTNFIFCRLKKTTVSVCSPCYYMYILLLGTYIVTFYFRLYSFEILSVKCSYCHLIGCEETASNCGEE